MNYETGLQILKRNFDWLYKGGGILVGCEYEVNEIYLRNNKMRDRGGFILKLSCGIGIFTL